MLPSQVRSLRKRLKLTQQQAAKLLNISKNTWIRWEKGQCKPDELALELLPTLGGKSSPEFCEHARKMRFDPRLLAEHLQYCGRCRLAVKYIVVVRKL
jgi:DNA-binding XRE family transcriptional regulator